MKQQQRNGYAPMPVVAKVCFVLLLVLILLLGSSMAVYQTMGLQLCKVEGSSMLPTIQKGSTALINPQKKKEHFDIVVFKGGDETFIKRVIGLPGDTVVVAQGQLSINGVPYEEPYVEEQNRVAFGGESFQVNVPEDCYFVLGDNRDHSFDSREAGVIQEEALLGVVSFLWNP